MIVRDLQINVTFATFQLYPTSRPLNMQITARDSLVYLKRRATFIERCQQMRPLHWTWSEYNDFLRESLDNLISLIQIKLTKV